MHTLLKELFKVSSDKSNKDVCLNWFIKKLLVWVVSSNGVLFLNVKDQSIKLESNNRLASNNVAVLIYVVLDTYCVIKM